MDPRLVPEINIGMVGHVDHGKTTLTSALTGKWTDTHSEEIKRGITIRLGYADATVYKCKKCRGTQCYGTTKKCMYCFGDCEPVRTISFVDAPGHEMLMTTVLSGTALMDGAILVIGANEHCPQPQTQEHLTVLNIAGIENIIIVQNKIDLVSEKEAMENYREIKEFVKGTVAENAPIIPVSAQQRINIDALIEAIENGIPTPKRDDEGKDPRMLIARSFDVNKPGTEIKRLRGGVLGGSLIRGKLKVGDEVEIRPGMRPEGSTDYIPIRTKITGLQKAMRDVDEAGAGGLLGVSTGLDPAVAKSDSLSGRVMGLPNKLPPVLQEVTLKTELLERVVGSREDLVVDPIKTGEAMMITVGISRTVGSVISAKEGEATLKLKLPICADKGERAALSRQVAGRWRLIGWGSVA
ncbi:MAG: translation initiation factor IF-2 subunit gamma [Candidatus Aenigmatarchaeota archaeon]|nr:MAG: translation initiation factor IF-2 subunit gamma [Candidatus Aenigmarchaeota archaeon]